MKLGELPEDDSVPVRAEKPEAETTNRLGITVAELDDEARKKLDLNHGVVVSRIRNGAASRAGVRKGDIILSINNKDVKSAKHFQSMIEAFPAGKSVAMLVQRAGNPTFLALKVPES